VLSVVPDPYDVVRPYSTWLVAGSSVVHEIVDLLLDALDAMFEIIGLVVSVIIGGSAVVNVLSPDWTEFPYASREMTL
jgi:hypothetical protein